MEGAANGGAWFYIIYFVIIALVFYFLLIRPQRKKQKAEEKLRKSLQVGDEIITIGGFHGRVVSIKDDCLVIESPVDHSKSMISNWAVQSNLTVHEESK